MIINFSQGLGFPSYNSEVYFVFDEENPNLLVVVEVVMEGGQVYYSSAEEKWR